MRDGVELAVELAHGDRLGVHREDLDFVLLVLSQFVQLPQRLRQ